ncbi:hypothetical protein PspLS_07329 [Pyricularia sp. CBS 133598]|nr:hypothetical protein PspLS_07329 [Pyricularia sp. CBS 133598]
MSITRAFTTRRVKQSLDLRDAAEGLVSRSNTTSKSGKTPKPLNSIRNKISAPVELVSTTNMLSYNAPDIYPKATSPSSTTTRSDDDSDSAPSIASTPPTSPDSPHPKKRTGELELEPNHLSCYFTAPGQAIAGPSSSGDAPAIPQRAPSHTKKHSQEVLTRQRSNSRMSEQSSRSLSSKASFSFSRSSSTSTNTSVASHTSTSYAKAPPPVSLANQATPLSTPPMAPVSHRREPSAAAHPFGHELAQVSELAEEYSSRESHLVSQQEEREILRQGYKKLSPQDYLSDVQDLYTAFFGEEKPSRPMWI